MYNHAPEDYDCPFCRVAEGRIDSAKMWTQPSDVVYRDEHTAAFLSARWWVNNVGHVMVIPKEHVENIYDLRGELAGHIHETARKVALAFKALYGCEGTSTRQHNEPAGYQEVFHYHLHVFPRYSGDNLYTSSYRLSTVEERLPYAEKLRGYLGHLE
jgi:histidine triad (HIT) family protein